ncbi:MAG: Tol-Pal system beta propeller repeat protein TolB [Pseudomonadota bacterium]
MKKVSTPAVVFLLALSVALTAAAQTRIAITQGSVEPIPIAISPFLALDPQSSNIAQDISAVLSANLTRTGLFRVIDQAAYLDSPSQLVDGPRFNNWRTINAQALIHGTVREVTAGRVRVEFRLWDIIQETQLAAIEYTAQTDHWRRIAHIISDAIFLRLTGTRGYFDTRIVYIDESGPVERRIKRLAIMDQDGARRHIITANETLTLTPRFSPNSSLITYLSYFNDNPQVFLLDIATGEQQLLGNFPGMTFAPRFFPRENKLVFSLAENSNSDIYTLDFETDERERLTTHPSIDTAPSISPDGQQMVFESDRSGTQQLYIMDLQSRNIERLTFDRGRFATPVWSPTGEYIAFTRINQGRFQLGIIRPDSTDMTILVDDFHVEGPSWSPNGQALIYFTQRPTGMGGRADLRVIHLASGASWTLQTENGGSDPAWSGYSDGS